MNTKQIANYPKLNSVLSSKYKDELLSILSRIISSKYISSLMNIYSLFIDIAVTCPNTTYSAIDIRISSGKLNQHFSALIGFLYSGHLDFHTKTQYKYSLLYSQVFTEFASRHKIILHKINTSEGRITEDAIGCVKTFQAMNPKSELISYYSGWTYKDKEGNQRNLHLATIYDCYGEAFTQRIYSAISNYTKTQKKTSAQAITSQLTILLNEFTKHCKTVYELEYSLKAENSTFFMESVLNTMLFQAMINEDNIKSFIREWKRKLKIFESCFINTNEFEEPLKPFLTPEFKEPRESDNSVSLGGQLSKEEEERWFFDIPLEIKDDDALNIIQERLNRDLKHIRIISQKIFNGILSRQKRNQDYIKNGEVKRLTTYANRSKYPKQVKDIRNSVATFYHYGFGVRSPNTSSFLGFKNKKNSLIQELNLPTTFNINALVSLLVLEHPKITPSWLQEWVLFNKNGARVGFKQSGNQWIAVSMKNRRGSTIAQQEVILNDYSKSIVELLIEYTDYSREALKKLGGDAWRYVILTATTQKPHHTKNLGLNLATQGAYHKALAVNSYNNQPTLIPFKVAEPFSIIYAINTKVLNLVLAKDEATELALITTPRAIRRARALQIYLQTHSLKAVAESLGHKTVDLKLLTIYLPKTLMDYFNHRWIRQFQNSIIYVALKDSPYLFNALDFDEDKLDEFLCYHKLNELPDNLKQIGFNTIYKENLPEIEIIDELVFTLSTPLFQVLIAILNVVETASEDDKFKPVVQKWHNSAVFILNQFSFKGRATNYRRGTKEAIPLYENALKNPLNLQNFKGNLLCR